MALVRLPCSRGPATNTHYNTRAAPLDGLADNLGVCKAQLNELNLIFTLGSATISASSLPCGVFLDTYGEYYFCTLLRSLHCVVLLGGAANLSRTLCASLPSPGGEVAE
jgi:hypothetical protein